MDIDKQTAGVDIENIYKFRGLKREKDRIFLEKIFTYAELDYCYSKADSAQHLAARYAAKEAVIKGVYAMGYTPPSINKIEIRKKNKAVPYIDLPGYRISISMSHCDDRAIAFALISKETSRGKRHENK